MGLFSKIGNAIGNAAKAVGGAVEKVATTAVKALPIAASIAMPLVKNLVPGGSLIAGVISSVLPNTKALAAAPSVTASVLPTTQHVAPAQVAAGIPLKEATNLPLESVQSASVASFQGMNNIATTNQPQNAVTSASFGGQVSSQYGGIKIETDKPSFYEQYIKPNMVAIIIGVIGIAVTIIFFVLGKRRKR